MALMERNLFLEIVERKLPADIVYEDDTCLAFRDITPQAPVHILIIPKKVIPTHAQLADDDAPLLGHMHLCARQIAVAEKLTDYRLVINSGAGSGQTVPHLHLHLLGGRPFGWPPG